MNREGTPGIPRSKSSPGLSGLVIDDAERDLTLFYPLAIPLVALVALILLSPDALVWALPTMILSGTLTFLATRDLKTATAATGIAPLVLTGTTGPATIALLALLVLAALLGSSLLLLPAAMAFLLPEPTGGILLAYAIALLVSWPHPERNDPAPLRGLRDGQRVGPSLDRIALAAALLLTLIAVVFIPPAWSAPVGLVAGSIARIVTRHPANARVGNSLLRIAAGLSVAPAVFLFLLAALGRLPPISDTRILVLTWGLLGVGLLILLAGLGSQLLLRSTGPWAAVAISAILTAALLAVAATFLLGPTQRALPLGTGWALLAPWIALGATRLAISYPKKPLIVWGAITLLVAIAYGIHAL